MQFHLSIPLSGLEENLEFVHLNGFQPEIRMTKVNYMMGLKKSDLDRMRERIDGHGFRPFTHGPFFGLDVASLDSNISEYSIRAMVHGVDVTAALGGSLMVIHTGYLPQFSRGGKRHWMRNWAARMPFVLEAAGKAGVTLALENTWDDRPEVLLRLADLLGGPVGFCIDTGHVNAFSKLSLDRWWNALEGRIVALHLHDNDGQSDDHLVPGTGTFDFERLA
ncbi:MAG TPA: sugar phosphate isomerase/epimerase family protein, partial [Candidatus Krumholzibacterium sp.]|nr:sugar phosphate isomerase/epimerase family protein [Candidatus Krumholzibacterium sp.]